MGSANNDNFDYDDDDDDDDEMADLFSFGASGTVTTLIDPSSSQKIVPIQSPSKKKRLDSTDKTSSSNICVTNDDDDSRASNDSFIELLENAQQNELSMLDSMTGLTLTENKTGNRKLTTDDSDMQEILDWLDDDDEKGIELLKRQEEELVFVQPPRPPSLEDSIAAKVTKSTSSANTKTEKFDSLEQAVKSRKSSKAQIRRLLEKEKFVVDESVRPHLWVKMICDKTLEEALQSSLADSFQQWEQRFWENSTSSEKGLASNEATTTTQRSQRNGDASKKDDQDDNQVTQMLQKDQSISRQELQRKWLEEQSKTLAKRIVSVVQDGDLEFYQKALLAILVNYFDSGSKSRAQNKMDQEDSSWKDSLLPPVLCSILSSGVPPPVACVMLGQIIPSYMPILALTTKERQEAAAILYHQFYLLACYHLPLLVLHLDKYIPDWYKCTPCGQLPQSWLMSHLAGETDGSFMNIRWLLHLWDLVLTSNNNSLRFFLVISILDFHAERLLLLTDEDLKLEFHRVISFDPNSNIDPTDPVEGNQSEEEENERQEQKWVQDWSDKAISLWEETPVAVVRKLKVLEDDAVTSALVARQKAKEEVLRLQQEAEEKAMQEAREVERERKTEEARKRLTRARLVAFYRQFNPGKENNIDKIMASYDGRYDVLDAKLKMKYGVGFNPALKSKPIVISKSNSKIFSTMNTGFGHRRTISKSNGTQYDDLESSKVQKVVVQVAPSEILPAICCSKDANRNKLSKLKKISKVMNDWNERNPLKFYLVDSRPENVAREQGKLPVSLSFSPETLVDVEKMEEYEAMFESLRGSVHICIMGEGYASLPELYGHKVTSELAELIKDDEERNNTCARFFLSRGFPFVSLVEGGFASSHAFLCREGAKVHLNVNNVLVDYNPEVSLFGRFERLHSMSGRDKAQRALQALFDSSMTALTKKSMRLETFANGTTSDERTNGKGATKNAVKRFFEGKRGTGNSLRDLSLGSLNPESTDAEKGETVSSPLLQGSTQRELSLKKTPGSPVSPTKGLKKPNPFSRFGSLSTAGKANKFAGSLNNFRKNTMAKFEEVQRTSKSEMS